MLSLHGFSGRAQYYAPENFAWVFGEGTMVDFSSGSPVIDTCSFYAPEGSASVANSTGQLLFYTDGKTVYNRNRAIMPSGAAVVTNDVSSTTQGSLIVPFINDSNKYYLFSISYPFVFSRAYFTLSYSIIDMSLDGGLGDVSPGTANHVLADSVSEKMIVVPGEGCHFWLITHRTDNNVFYVYKITSDGISGPAEYAIGLMVTPPFTTSIYGNGYHMGGMRCSHDRRMLFLASWQDQEFPKGTGELYDFDPATGVISNCRKLSDASLYGGEFSPDNTKLYVNNLDVSSIQQYDLSSPNLADILASCTIITGGNAASTGLRLGPDGKIYSGRMGNTFLGRIENPNVSGIGCHYVSNAVDISPKHMIMGLPNLVWKLQGVSSTISGPSEVCVGDTITLSNTSPFGVWVTGNSSIATTLPAGQVVGVSAGTVIITYSVPEGECFAITTVTVKDCETFIGEISTGAIANIYPVPAENELVIDMHHYTSGMLLTMVDAAGRHVYSAPLTQKKSVIVLSNLSPGAYTCIVSGPAGTIPIRRFILKR
jgi:hypothetical protein